MSTSKFALLRNFSTTKFYNAAQSGTLTGTAPFTFGALFSLRTVADFDSAVGIQTIFGNAVFGTSGFGIRQLANGTLEMAQGTVQQLSGTAEAAADGTYGLDPEGDLINMFRGQQLGTVSAAGWNTPKPGEMILAHVVIDGTNQDLFINTHHRLQTTRNTTTNANPVRVGVNASAAEAGILIDVAGVFYDNVAWTEAQLRAHYEACISAKAMALPSNAGGALDPDYLWDVKSGNPDARASWTSRGTATAIDLVRNGTWTAASDVVGADRPWYQP